MAKLILAAIGVIWAVGLLFVAYQYSQNGRYQLKAGDSNLMVDTRTGQQFRYDWQMQEWKQSTSPPTQ